MTNERIIKVLHVIYSLGMGGAERVIVNYAKFSDKDKYELYICALSEGGPYENDLNRIGVHYFVLNKKKGLNDIKAISKLFRILRDNKIDVVHFHDLSSSLWGTIPAVISGAKVIVRTVHTVKTKDIDILSRIKSFVESIMYIFHDQIIFVSEAVKNNQIGKSIFKKDKYTIIYNGIDEDIFKVKLDKNKYINELNLHENHPLIGIIGRFITLKGHEVFLNAMELILKKRSGVGALVIGDGPRKDELIKLSTVLGIRDNVFFTGIRNDIPQILNLIDILALSSFREGFPMTILEAMGCGKPVVVTDVGGNSEAVIDGETGYIVPPGDAIAMSEAIIKLIDNQELRRKMGDKGRERISSHFTADVMVRKTETLYSKFIN